MSELTHVTFRKQVSDGNYGTEAAEVTLDCDPAVAGLTLAKARQLVHEELARSPSANVRRAVQPPAGEALAAAGGDDAISLEDLPF